MLELFNLGEAKIQNNTNDRVEGLVDIIEELVLQTTFQEYEINRGDGNNIDVVKYIDIIEPGKLLLLAQWRKRSKVINLNLWESDKRKRIRSLMEKEEYLPTINSCEEILHLIYADKRYKGSYTPPHFEILKTFELTDVEEFVLFEKSLEDLSRSMYTGRNAIAKYVWGYIEERFEQSNEHLGLYTKQRYFYTQHRGCYMVTACVQSQGLEDNCEELEIMRWYRDTILNTMLDGERLIKDYYAIAPEVVRKVMTLPNREVLLSQAYRQEVIPIVTLVQQQQYEQAQQRLFRVMRQLQKLYSS